MAQQFVPSQTPPDVQLHGQVSRSGRGASLDRLASCHHSTCKPKTGSLGADDGGAFETCWRRLDKASN